MSDDVDKLRSQLYLDLGAWVDLRRAAADPDDPKWRTEALVRINQVYRYATLAGRRRFLDEMKLPGADQKRRTTFDVCVKDGGDEASCRAKAEALPLFRDIFEAFPKTNTLKEWYSAPITQLVGTYDPKNPPADELKDWRDTLREESPGTAYFVDGVEEIGDAVGDLGQGLGDKLIPSLTWLKVGAAVATLGFASVVAYRVARRENR